MSATRPRHADSSETALRRARDHAMSVIDLHCHLLPGIDDGPRSMDGALALARAQVAAGVSTVAATPHVSWDMPTDAAAIDVGLADLRAALADEGIPLEVVRGAEIDVHQAEELNDEELSALALGGGRWLLLEAPLRPGVALERAALDLLDRGHRVLLAHPERSPLLQRDPALLRRLARAGALTQVTAGSLLGRFGRTVQRFTDELLELGLVHTIASDAHDAIRRPPGIANELAAAGLGDLVPLLAHEVPAAILTGDAIPHVPRRVRRRHGTLRGLLRR
jgi:protein-tyrosine phosphatase